MFEISEGPPEFGVYLGDGSGGGWSIGQSVEHCESMDGAEVANSSYPHARFGQLSQRQALMTGRQRSAAP
jgi:hypothetical protein